MLIICLEAWKISDLSSCKPLGLEIDFWISAVGISILGLLAFLWSTLWRALTIVVLVLRSALMWIWHKAFNSGEYKKFCVTLRPLVRDNKRIFEAFGPKSGQHVEEVRYDLSLWLENRHKIANNNETIKSEIMKNYNIIPKEYLDKFDEWLSHIDAFQAHILNESVDYRNNRFPVEIANIIGADDDRQN